MENGLNVLDNFVENGSTKIVTNTSNQGVTFSRTIIKNCTFVHFVEE